MNNENKYFDSAEIVYLKKAFRILEIIIEEYTYKNLKFGGYSIIIPKGRFELEGIFLDDIEFCLKYFVNLNEQGNLIIRLENNFILKNNIKFRSKYPAEANNPMFKKFFELNELEYAENFVFSTFKEFNYQKLIDIHNNLQTIIENKKISLTKNISNFLYFQDRILFVHNSDSSTATQIDLSKKEKRSPDKMFYFISSFINLVKELGKFTEKGFEAEIPIKLLIEQIQKDHNVIFSNMNLSDTKRNFVHTKISEKLVTKFIISDYQKSTKSYNFKLILN